MAGNALNKAISDIRQGMTIAVALKKHHLTIVLISLESVLKRWLSLSPPVIGSFHSGFDLNVSAPSNRALLQPEENTFTDRTLDHVRDHGSKSQIDVSRTALLFWNELLSSNCISKENRVRLKRFTFGQYWDSRFLEKKKYNLKTLFLLKSTTSKVFLLTLLL